LFFPQEKVFLVDMKPDNLILKKEYDMQSETAVIQ